MRAGTIYLVYPPPLPDDPNDPNSLVKVIGIVSSIMASSYCRLGETYRLPGRVIHLKGRAKQFDELREKLRKEHSRGNGRRGFISEREIVEMALQELFGKGQNHVPVPTGSHKP